MFKHYETTFCINGQSHLICVYFQWVHFIYETQLETCIGYFVPLRKNLVSKLFDFVSQNILHIFIGLSINLKPHYLSETKYSSKNKLYRKVITMKYSPKLSFHRLLWSPFKNMELFILHGSENAPFVYILYTEYSDV